MTSNPPVSNADRRGDPRSGSPRRRRHLIDPNTPRPPRDTTAEIQSLTRVQRWVASSLAVTTILHLAAGLILAAAYLPRPTLSGQIGLNLLAGVLGVTAVMAALAIHGRRIVSWWLVLGVVPAPVGLYLVLR